MPDTATPTAPPAAAPAQTPSASAPQSSSGASGTPPATEPKSSANPFSAIDKKAKEKKSAEEVKPDKSGEKPADPAADKPKDNAAEKVEDSELPPEDKSRVETPLHKKLRGIAETNIRKVKEMTPELERLRSENEQLKKGGGNATVLTEQLAAKDKEIEALRSEIGTYRYEKNPEFIAKYEKPFTSAAQYAKSLIEGLTIDQDGTPRKADWDIDFGYIFSLAPVRAESEAQTMFGTAASAVMRQYEKLHELKRERDNALSEYQNTAGERAKTEEAERVRKETEEQQKREQAIESTTKAFAAVTKDLQDEEPDLYSPDPKDKESEAIYKESLALVDQAYFARDKMKPEQRIALDAAIRLRAAAHPMLVRKLALKDERIAELESALKDKDGDVPGEVRQRGSGSQPAKKGFFDDMRESVPTV